MSEDYDREYMIAEIGHLLEGASDRDVAEIYVLVTDALS